MNRLIYPIIIGAFLSVFSCTSDTLPEGVQLELCETTTVTYDEQVKTIIDRTCAYVGCHDSGGGAPGNFETFIGMENWLNVNQFERRVIQLENMPDPNDVLPEALLTPEELELLTCWVQQGYLEN